MSFYAVEIKNLQLMCKSIYNKDVRSRYYKQHIKRRFVMDKNISYAGKQVNIGIDVHKSKYAVAVECEGVKAFQGVLPATPQNLIHFIQSRFKGAQVQTVYEAGFSGFALHRALEESGMRNIVVNPASIEISQSKVKTDKLDALKLAEQLSKGMLRGIKIPSPEEESARLLSRTRAQLVDVRKKFVIQMQTKLHYFGLYPAGVKRLTILLIKEIIEREKIPLELKTTINSLISAYNYISEEIRKLESELRKQAQNDKNEKLYRSVPGVGFVAARMLSNELGDLRQFSSAKKLSSFVGLTPTEHSSGESIRRGHITRQGSARLRGILNQVSWVAIKRDSFLRDYYDRLKVRCGAKKAIVAVSHKLLCRMHHMFKFQEEYRSA